MQMQRMQIGMKLPLKHETRHAQHFAEVTSEPVKYLRWSFLLKT